MKNKKTIITLFIYAIIGFSLGILRAFGGDVIKYFGINIGLPDAADFLMEYIIVPQIIVATTLTLIIVYNYNSVKNMIFLEMKEEDDEDLAKKIDSIQDKALTIGVVNYICSFALFGISIDDRNPWILGSAVIFLIFMAITFFLEIKVINQVKQRDPMKKGNPMSDNFKEEWIDSCDEAEKLMIFKAAYKSFLMMQYVLIVFMVICMLTKSIFGTGNLPIILIGLLWLTQTLSYSYYCKELQKNKLNIPL